MPFVTPASVSPGDTYSAANHNIIVGDINDLDSRVTTNAAYLCPVGSVMQFAGSTAPTGWLICDGCVVPAGTGVPTGGSGVNTVSADYSALRTLIGSTYGSAGKIPDIRGRVPLGAGTGSGLTARTLGDATIGAETHTLTPAQTAIRNHYHDLTWENQGSSGGETATVGTGRTGISQSNGSGVAAQVYIATGIGGGRSVIYVGSTPEANGTSHNNMQPSLVLNYIIKY